MGSVRLAGPKSPNGLCLTGEQFPGSQANAEGLGLRAPEAERRPCSRRESALGQRRGLSSVPFMAPNKAE